MRVLLADDDAVSRHMLGAALGGWGFDPVVVVDGTQAWAELQKPDAPLLCLIDWVMPGLEAPELCRRLRDAKLHPRPYVVVLTARDFTTALVEVLDAGADDYVAKPFVSEVLRARLSVGVRVLDLQAAMFRVLAERQEALARLKRLRGLLPICRNCKRIRDNRDYWGEVEQYMRQHAEVSFTHGICPACYETVIRPQIEQLRQKMRQDSE